MLSVHMEYSSDSERPVKRFKTSQPFSHHSTVVHHEARPPMSSAPDITVPDGLFNSLPPQMSPMVPDSAPPSSVGQTLDLPLDHTVDHPWPSPQGGFPPDLAYSFSNLDSQDNWGISLPPSLGSPNAAQYISSAVISPPSELDIPVEPPPSAGFPPQVQLILPTSSQYATASKSRGSSAELSRQNTRVVGKTRIVSPFRDCLESFGTFPTNSFTRPKEGYVNGYIKFTWGNREMQNAPETEEPPSQDTSLEVMMPVSTSTVPPTAALAMANFVGPPQPQLVTDGLRVDTSTSPSSIVDLSPITGDMSMSTMFMSQPSSLASSPNMSNGLVNYHNDPQMLPPQFGFHAKVDVTMDRKFWQFYIKNWCPGRTTLKKTNLWVRDFASMYEREGVRAAMMCVAGVYIYDYVPQPKIKKRVNELFSVAEARLTQLMNDPNALEKDCGNELITIATLLSMQDIILTERRRKRPHHPRWLAGFLQGESALQATDPGARFWHKSNVQLNSLRVAQSIMVGRAVILAQPMMPLTAPKDFDPQIEASRFGWLLYGKESEMYEIHGGCGFSKKLLHVVSQITYCAARLQQEPESPIAPMTMQFLLDELIEMKQWSSESRSWKSAKEGAHTIEWVRSQPPDFKINNSSDMTDVTAEAWRFAVIVYLQCRALRLPRNHPEVIANLADLALCIRIMPTSGSNFTAQSPLFPVFLLGAMAVVKEHKEVSQAWFQDVVTTPVRSSVPPLYQVLERIWEWLDKLLPVNDDDIPESVSERSPWWEDFIARVQEKETETLCLT